MMKNNLRKILRTQGRTIAWLARETGLSHYKVKATMLGYREPTIEEMITIARVLQLPVEVIFFELDVIIGSNKNNPRK